MRILQVLSALLSYPSAELKQAVPELRAAVASATGLGESVSGRLAALLDELAYEDLYEVQARYVAQFDRGRALSLHLFEHVHGESRDRGQAMVDLIDVYRKYGFALAARELPDYLPLFLEFLAQIPAQDARELLVDAMPVMSLIGARLASKDSSYACVFEALIQIVGPPEDEVEIRRRVAAEGPDQTVLQMDRIWEEEAVTFLGNQGGGCGSGGATEKPLRPMPRPSN